MSSERNDHHLGENDQSLVALEEEEEEEEEEDDDGEAKKRHCNLLEYMPATVVTVDGTYELRAQSLMSGDATPSVVERDAPSSRRKSRPTKIINCRAHNTTSPGYMTPSSKLTRVPSCSPSHPARQLFTGATSGTTHNSGFQANSSVSAMNHAMMDLLGCSNELIYQTSHIRTKSKRGRPAKNKEKSISSCVTKLMNDLIDNIEISIEGKRSVKRGPGRPPKSTTSYSRLLQMTPEEVRVSFMSTQKIKRPVTSDNATVDSSMIPVKRRPGRPRGRAGITRGGVVRSPLVQRHDMYNNLSDYSNRDVMAGLVRKGEGVSHSPSTGIPISLASRRGSRRHSLANAYDSHSRLNNGFFVDQMSDLTTTSVLGAAPSSPTAVDQFSSVFSSATNHHAQFLNLVTTLIQNPAMIEGLRNLTAATSAIASTLGHYSQSHQQACTGPKNEAVSAVDMNDDGHYEAMEQSGEAYSNKHNPTEFGDRPYEDPNTHRHSTHL
ncbi:hypothetical protein ACOME3_001409 [Neoechinorhynchus agilis]